MARRPVFSSIEEGNLLVKETCLTISWASGFAEVQKRKNIKALHEAAKVAGLGRVLEISTKSSEVVGQRLSAFNLMYELDGYKFPLESVYQSAKVFEISGHHGEWIYLSPRDAKRAAREFSEESIVSFNLGGKQFPIVPKTAFYDFIYLKSLAEHADWIVTKISDTSFSDIEFNPSKQVNCQARSFALLLSLLKRNLLYEYIYNFEVFSTLFPSEGGYSLEAETRKSQFSLAL